MNDTQTQNLESAMDLEAFGNQTGGPSWMADLRREALERYHSSTWPTTSEEEWRRTNLSAFTFEEYGLLSGPEYGSDSTDAAPLKDASSLAGLVSWENARVTSNYLDPTVADQGVRFGRLADALSDPQVAEVVRGALERSLAVADNRLIYWHFAMLADSAVLYVPANVIVDRPFEVVYRYEGDELVHAPHMVVVLERGAQASVVRRLHSSGEGEVLLVDGSELIVEAGARLRYVNLERLNDESLYFCNDRGNVGRDGFIHRTEVALGADFVKTRYVSELTGEGADTVLNGIYFTREEQHADLRTVQQHRAAHTTSRAFYRGAVRDESHAIYQGLIQVDHEAVGTDAYLTNKNLILGEEARADSIPSLNISTDDVRCSHGSTTGKLDPAQVFYLRSRGYSEAEAKQLLVEGYFEDLIEQTPSSLHEELRGLIMDRIAE
jgi:Fe-S cluster assembly protein SufD